jgi:hypothetical protein
MTELKRAISDLEEAQNLLACYLSVKEANAEAEGRLAGLGVELCGKMTELGAKVSGIEVRYNKSILGNGSIYGPKTTQKVKTFLESFRAVQVRMNCDAP